MQHDLHLTPDFDSSIFFDMKNTYPLDTPTGWHHLSHVFSALGDKERQRILFSFSPGTRVNASGIAQTSTLSRTTVSHHLKLLCDAGILERSRHGREVHFQLRAGALIDHLQSVIDYLEQHR